MSFSPSYIFYGWDIIYDIIYDIYLFVINHIVMQ